MARWRFEARDPQRTSHYGRPADAYVAIACFERLGKACVSAKLLLWCILFVLCWPLAVLALLLYPVVWLILLPVRLAGIAVGATLDLMWVIVTLPARVLRKLTGPPLVNR